VSQIEIYIDEDAMDSDLVAALRSRGVIIITALDAGLVGKSDDEQLTFASDHGCVLYTFNVSDFYRLHTRYLDAGQEHAGMNSVAAAEVLGRGTAAPHPASSNGNERRKHAEPSRVPQQLGLIGRRDSQASLVQAKYETLITSPSDNSESP
jgi:hypothetical protein